MIRAMRTTAWTTVVAASLLLAACGGGGGGGFLAGGGTSGTGITQGTVTSFGSVVVNGTRYQTSDDNPDIATEFEGPEIAGNPFDAEADLAVGMLVQVEWERPVGADDRQATRITHLPELIGPVTGAFTIRSGPGIATLEVAGRTVVVDAGTVVDDPLFRAGMNSNLTEIMSLADLAVDTDIVQVSGLLEATTAGDGGSQIRAARVARVGVADADPLETVTGRVSNPQEGSFQIVDPFGTTLITVNFVESAVADASLLDPSGSGALLMDEAAVRVRGQFNSGPATLQANTPGAEIRRPLEDLQPVNVDPGDPDAQVEAEIRGVITQPAGSGDTFAVTGQTVRFDASDLPPGTMAPQALVPGVRVEVKGLLIVDDGSVILDAEEIRFEREAEVELEDRVAGDLSGPDEEGNRSFDTRVGLTVVIQPDTVLKDDTDQATPNGSLDLATFVNDDFVEVRGFFDDDGQLIARILEREDEDSEEGCKLEARVASFEQVINGDGLYRFQLQTGAVVPGLAVLVPGAATQVVGDGAVGEFESDDVGGCSVPTGSDPTIEAGFTANDVEGSDDGGGILPGGANAPGTQVEDLPGTVATVDNDPPRFILETGQAVKVLPQTTIDDSLIKQAAPGAGVDDDLPFSEVVPSLVPSLKDLLPVGLLMEISGTILPDGTIEATKLEFDDGDDD